MAVNATMIGPNLLVAWLCSAYLGAHYTVASAAGVLVHITGAFFLNRRFTFKRMDVSIFWGLMKVYWSESFAILIMFGVMAVCVENIGMSEIAARFVGLAIVAVYDYFFQKHVTFGHIVWRFPRRKK